jgi:hypothetical protein
MFPQSFDRCLRRTRGAVDSTVDDTARLIFCLVFLLVHVSSKYSPIWWVKSQDGTSQQFCPDPRLCMTTSLLLISLSNTGPSLMNEANFFSVSKAELDHWITRYREHPAPHTVSTNILAAGKIFNATKGFALEQSSTSGT